MADGQIGIYGWSKVAPNQRCFMTHNELFKLYSNLYDIMLLSWVFVSIGVRWWDPLQIPLWYPFQYLRNQSPSCSSLGSLGFHHSIIDIFNFQRLKITLIPIIFARLVSKFVKWIMKTWYRKTWSSSLTYRKK